MGSPLEDLGKIFRADLLTRNLPLPDGWNIDGEIDLTVQGVASKKGELDRVANEVITAQFGKRTYTEEDQYPGEQMKKLQTANTAVSEFANLVTGRGDIDLASTVFGRVLTAPVDSQLGIIGLERLVIEFSRRFIDNQLFSRFPSINFRDSEGNLDLANPNVEPSYISDTRAFRFYYIGKPWDEPDHRLRDTNMPPNTAGGMVNSKDPNLVLRGEDFDPLDSPNFYWESQDKKASIDDTEKTLGAEFLGSFKPRSNKFKRGILRLTQQIINDSTLKGSDNLAGRAMDMTRKVISSKSDGKGFDGELNRDYYSKGSAVVRNTQIRIDRDGKETDDVDGEVKNIKEFCRVWTVNDQYDNINSAIRHRKYDDNSISNPKGSKLSTNSVLTDNGTLRIAPNSPVDDVKNFMFSIENLAWVESGYKLSDQEKGPNGGKIMWFPPYDLSFNDNSSVSWDTSIFIGRGEPIYTYNHTERTGNLDFKLIVDYPMVMDKFRLVKDYSFDDSKIEAFWSGCEDLKEELEKLRIFDQELIDELSLQTVKQTPEANKASVVAVEPTWNDLKFYFDDRSDVVDPSYETLDLNSIFNGSDTTNASKSITQLLEYLNDGDNKTRITIVITGFAGLDESFDSDATELLSFTRASNMASYIAGLLFEDSTNTSRYKVMSQGAQSTNTRTDRFVSFRLIANPNSVNFQIGTDIEEEFSVIDTEETRNKLNEFLSRHNWFQKMTANDKFTASLKERIKFFHPAFHSQTPQNFNSRLNFLLQCTRQGPSIGQLGGGSPQNAAFGRPPVCVLRLGDFYHTKIIIDNVQYSFDPIIWDLNPEGIGVQPMICDVNISFKFIGGSDISGPINELQNAVSFHFFANTNLFDYVRPKEAQSDAVDANKPVDTDQSKVNDATQTDSKPVLQKILTFTANYQSDSRNVFFIIGDPDGSLDRSKDILTVKLYGVNWLSQFELLGVEKTIGPTDDLDNGFTIPEQIIIDLNQSCDDNDDCADVNSISLWVKLFLNGVDTGKWAKLT